MALDSEAQETIRNFRNRAPGLERFFSSAYGWAVFPEIGKGGVGVGGAYGRGVVYEQGAKAGYCDLSQGTVGLQLGGQSYSELIFFQSPESMSRFKSNTMELSAQASAVAVEAGASATADYMNGVAIFTLARAGFMGEASIGGQQFTFEPVR